MFKVGIINVFEIFFEISGYDVGYKILTRSADTITVADPLGTLTDGSQKWVIRGFRKNEVFELESYSVKFWGYGESHTAFSAGEDGGNAP